jgi:hypothetical protein
MSADFKRYIFNCFSKDERTVWERRSAGSAFQAAGSANEKERSLLKIFMKTGINKYYCYCQFFRFLCRVNLED